MASPQQDEEERVLQELLKWSGGPEDDPSEKRKNLNQAFFMSALLIIVSAALFYFDPPSKFQVIGGLVFVASVALFCWGTIIRDTSNNLKYTERYIDTDAIRDRLQEIKLNKGL